MCDAKMYVNKWIGNIALFDGSQCSHADSPRWVGGKEGLPTCEQGCAGGHNIVNKQNVAAFGQPAADFFKSLVCGQPSFVDPFSGLRLPVGMAKESIGA